MSMVSLAFSFCFSGFINSRVRILWRRSASFMRITRMSFAMARNIFRRFSAWISTLSMDQDSWVSLVTPSTKRATSGPNTSVISSRVITVSSTTSWRIPATMLSLSSSRSARMMATQRGWMM